MGETPADPNASAPFTGSPALLEQAWLNQLNAVRNAVYQECRLPGDRPATPAEMHAFYAGLQRLETYFTSVQPIAAQLDALGLPTLSQQLAVMLKDVQDARAVFHQLLKDAQDARAAFHQAAVPPVQNYVSTSDAQRFVDSIRSIVVSDDYRPPKRP